MLAFGFVGSISFFHVVFHESTIDIFGATGGFRVYALWRGLFARAEFGETHRLRGHAGDWWSVPHRLAGRCLCCLFIDQVLHQASASHGEERFCVFFGHGEAIRSHYRSKTPTTSNGKSDCFPLFLLHQWFSGSIDSSRGQSLARSEPSRTSARCRAAELNPPMSQKRSKGCSHVTRK